MNYVVTIDGERRGVSVVGDSVSADGETLHATLAEVEGTPIRMVTIGTEVHRVVVQRRHGRGAYTLWLDGYRYEVEALDERTRAIRDVTGSQAAAAGPAPLKAPMPGLIVRVTVSAGDRVEVGQGLVVMEAMKMENELRATAPGTVRAVLVTPGTAVDKGAVLVELE